MSRGKSFIWWLVPMIQVNRFCARPLAGAGALFYQVQLYLIPTTLDSHPWHRNDFSMGLSVLADGHMIGAFANIHMTKNNGS